MEYVKTLGENPRIGLECPCEVRELGFKVSSPIKWIGGALEL